MRTAYITPEGDRFALTFAYSSLLVEDLKATVPGPARGWIKARRVWLIDADWAEAVLDLLDAHGYRVYGSPPRRAAPTAGWAVALFAALPQRLHEPVFRALLKVLHPDAGGDTAAMQQLNAARSGRAS